MTLYSDEVAGLPATFTLARLQPLAGNLNQARQVLFGRDLYSIGSGGTAAVADLAVELHRKTTLHSATAMTPLRFVETASARPRSAVIIFSARAKHPDTAFAATTALAHGMPIVLITQRDASELSGALADPRVTVLTVPSSTGKDGFLATQSVLTMAVIVARVYLPDSVPKALEHLGPSDRIRLRQRLLVLHGQAGLPAARDIETRMHELGLADVQVADWRNFAHGRHVGLLRRAESTTVIALVTAETNQLAHRTISVLPPEIDLRLFQTEESGIGASLQLLASVMRLPTIAKEIEGIEPSRPKVAAWGRKLYHLPFKRIFPSTPDSPALRKAASAGAASQDQEAKALYEEAYLSWRKIVRKTPIGALVLDYDGTCVTTAGRWELPTPAVQTALNRLLSVGVPISFATGRGDSLYQDLRKWVPKEAWCLIDLGLHNGAWRQGLGESLIEPSASESEWSVELRRRLDPYVKASLVAIRSGARQLAVNSPGNRVSVDSLRELVKTCAHDLPVNVASSAHSVDVFDLAIGKRDVLRDAEKRWGNVLAIGDRGELGGNDFDLLASTALSVSVDRCSSDLTRCWPISRSNMRGPSALVEVLNSISVQGAEMFLSPSTREYGKS